MPPPGAGMSEKRYYMACLLRGRDVLVVGAGSVAREKIRGPSRRRRARDRRCNRRLRAGRGFCALAAAGADPRAVQDRGSRRTLPRRRGDLDHGGERARLRRRGGTRDAVQRLVDVPELCSFILPAVHRDDPIVVAISTGGASPALAQRLRDDVARLVTPRARAARARSARAPGHEVKEHLPTYEARRDFFPRARRGASRVTVALVGAGPGDPGLITVRGLELPPRVRRRSCTTASSPPSSSTSPQPMPCGSRATGLLQKQIDGLLVALGRQGLEVVRLKGGDPYVFGRGGEEALALAEAGIPFEVVPGISSIAAVPAAAGVPVTHRGPRGPGDDRDGGTPPTDRRPITRR